MSRQNLVISPDEMRAALESLAALADADGVELHLHITGGTVMMLEFESRDKGTRDCDVLHAEPNDRLVEYGEKIAAERGSAEEVAQHECSQVRPRCKGT
jgi:hypothetical protein